MGFFNFFKRRHTLKADAAPQVPQWRVDAEIEDIASYIKRYGVPPLENGPLSKNAFDAVSNWMSGQGGINDPAMASAYLFAATIDWQTISNMCRASWLARKIVWKKARDKMRPGYTLVFEGMGDKRKGDTETAGDILRRNIARRWDADNKIVEADAWGRQFGGSIFVVDIKGQLLDQPLPVKNGMVDYSSIGKDSLNSLRVWDRWRANHDGELDDNNDSPNRGKPMFHVLSADGGLTGQRVHWTRCIQFDGDIVDWWTWRANACWHDSVLQVLVDSLKQYDTLTGAVSSLVPKARQDVVYAKDAAKNAATAEGRQKMSNRYSAAARLASTNNVRVYDMDAERVEQQTFNFGGLDNIWQKSMMEIGGGGGYPSSVLFDNQPSGLRGGQGGEASLTNYYDDLAAERSSYLKLRQLLLYEIIARDAFGEVPQGFSIEYAPFQTATEYERSQINLNRANADHIRIQDKVVSPRDVASQNKEDSVYTVVTQESVNKVPEDAPAAPASAIPGAPAPAEKETKPAKGKAEGQPGENPQEKNAA